MSCHPLDLSKFEKIRKIGEGGFGEVFIIREKETDKQYVAKISLHAINPRKIDEMLNISREININASIDHPLFLKFIGYNLNKESKELKPLIMTEYASNGSLRNAIDLERLSRAPAEWDQEKKFFIIYGISAGMSFLHKNDVIHRDLKPSNILLDDEYRPKIADLGLSKEIGDDIQSIHSAADIKGTFLYLAPEIIKDKIYTKSSDVFAFAMIVYEIVTNTIPFDKVDYYLILPGIVDGKRPVFHFPIAEAYRNLIERCWSQDPNRRPTFDEIVNELKTNKKFSEFYDEDNFLDFVELIEEYPSKYDKEKQVVKIEDFSNPIEIKLMKLKIKSFDLSGFKIIKTDKEKNFFVIKNGIEKLIVKKIIKFDKEDDDSYIEKIQIIVDEKSIFSVKGITFTDINNEYYEYPFLIQDCAEHGTLEEFIEKSKEDKLTLTDTKKMIIIYGIARKMLRLQDKSIIYGNLNLSNILLNEKLCPFLRCFNEKGEVLFKKLTDVNSKEEINKCLQSYGKIMYYILTGQNADKSSILSSNEDSIPSFFLQLIKSLFDEDSNKILSFSDIIKLFDSGITFPSILYDRNEVSIYFNYIRSFDSTIKFNIENMHFHHIIMKKSSENSSFKSIINKFWCFIEENYSEIITDEFNVVYRILKIGKTAEIVKSPKATDEIIIPSTIKYEDDDYPIIKICDNSFEGTSITSLSFNQHSKLLKIGDYVFMNSAIQRLVLPLSLFELSNFCFTSLFRL